VVFLYLHRAASVSPPHREQRLLRAGVEKRFRPLPSSKRAGEACTEVTFRPLIVNFCGALRGPNGDVYARAVRRLQLLSIEAGQEEFDFEAVSDSIQRLAQLQELDLFLSQVSDDFLTCILLASRKFTKLRSLSFITRPTGHLLLCTLRLRLRVLRTWCL
jgi:hypothetical protein